jgi:hypothetical protein
VKQTIPVELYGQTKADLIDLIDARGMEKCDPWFNIKIKHHRSPAMNKSKTEEFADENTHSMARRRMIKALPFVAAGGLMMLLSSCTPTHNTARRTSRRTSRRVTRRR